MTESTGCKNGCIDDGLGCRHEYAEKICAECGRDFCWSCCNWAIAQDGRRHQPDFMACPSCGHDWYQKEET